MNFGVEVFQQLPARTGHGVIDLEAQLELKLVKRRLDLLRRAAPLIDARDAFFEVDARFDRAENLVAGAEHAFEERELFRQKPEYPLIGLVVAIQEIDDHHIMLLPVAMATADPLLNTLRIPRQIVVDHQGQNCRLMPSAPASVAIMIRPSSRK